MLKAHVIKFEGKASAFAYGISTFETDDDREAAETGYNGYFGVEQEVFNIYAGYETRENGNEDEEAEPTATGALIEAGDEQSYWAALR